MEQRTVDKTNVVYADMDNEHSENFKAARAAARAPFEAFNQLKGLNPSDCYQ